MLQPYSLKLESYKFNIIINIINITLESSVATKLKVFGHIFQKNLTLLDLSIFWYFLFKKKKFNLWRVPLFFFFRFSFLSLLLWLHSTVHSEKTYAFSFFCLFFLFSLLILIFFYLIIRLSCHGSQVWLVNPVYSDFFFLFLISFFFFL
jgi:hypothetical protein